MALDQLGGRLMGVAVTTLGLLVVSALYLVGMASEPPSALLWAAFVVFAVGSVAAKWVHIQIGATAWLAASYVCFSLAVVLSTLWRAQALHVPTAVRLGVVMPTALVAAAFVLALAHQGRWPASLHRWSSGRAACATVLALMLITAGQNRGLTPTVAPVRLAFASLPAFDKRSCGRVGTVIAQLMELQALGAGGASWALAGCAAWAGADLRDLRRICAHEPHFSARPGGDVAVDFAAEPLRNWPKDWRMALGLGHQICSWTTAKEPASAQAASADACARTEGSLAPACLLAADLMLEDGRVDEAMNCLLHAEQLGDEAAGPTAVWQLRWHGRRPPAFSQTAVSCLHDGLACGLMAPSRMGVRTLGAGGQIEVISCAGAPYGIAWWLHGVRHAQAAVPLAHLDASEGLCVWVRAGLGAALTLRDTSGAQHIWRCAADGSLCSNPTPQETCLPAAVCRGQGARVALRASAGAAPLELMLSGPLLLGSLTRFGAQKI